VPDPLALLDDFVTANPEEARAVLARYAQRRDKDLKLDPDTPLTADQMSRAARMKIADTFGWSIFGVLEPRSRNTVCHARVELDPGLSNAPPAVPQEGVVGIGSTPAEAFAAYLGKNRLKADPENRLVQALAATDLRNHALDLGQKLRESRHNEQFQARKGHSIWVIRPGGQEDQGNSARLTLPEGLAHELNLLNELQEAFDRNLERTDTLKQALFDDWHHYMRAVYPEGDRDPFAFAPDALRELLIRTRLEPLEALQRQTGRLYIAESPAGDMLVTDRDPALGNETPIDISTLAHQVVQQHRVVLAALADADGGTGGLHIGLTPGPRYWQPHDPVIVLDDPHVRTRDRHGHAGRYRRTDPNSTSARSAVYKSMLVESWVVTDDLAFAGNRRVPHDLRQSTFNRERRLGWTVRQGAASWDPRQLEWEVELRPQARGSNLQSGRYRADFVTASQQLRDDHADLERGAGGPDTADTYEYLAGRSILNPAAGRLLRKRLKAYSPDIASGVRATPMVLPLGGFNDQLLMRRRELQIAIDDPIGLPGQRALAARVDAALAQFHPATPRPDGVFQPIRSGEIHIQRLRVIDSFGRSRDWKPKTIRTALRMRAETDRKAMLPLRLAQPARLNFRWLSAAHGTVESNVHPATSPICGWFLPNDLDGEIAVYAGSGHLLGSVGNGGIWLPAPGDDAAPRSWRDIADSNLARAVRWLTDNPEQDLTGVFLEMLEAALQQIDPKDAATHQARAVLIGRPVALVRARLRLVLQQGMPTDQSLRALLDRLQGGQPDTHGLESVRFPVRLGEHGQLDDGLCGYWIEDGHDFAGNEFHLPHGVGTGTSHPRISVPDSTRLRDYPLQLTADGAALTLSMLVDPRGSVHATTGILPTKSIAIPPDQYQDHLASLRVTFRTAPVLTPRDRVELPLPNEPGFSWSWLERGTTGWSRVPHHPTIRKADFLPAFGPPGPALWDMLVTEGRIELAESTEEGVLQAGNPNLPPERFHALGLQPEQVERGLHGLAQAIDEVGLDARYRPRPVARDGWLELRPTPQPTQPQTDTPLDLDWGETS